MEVLASVAIITVVGLALLQIASNNTRLITYILEKKSINNVVSILAGHLGKTDNKSEKELYETIRKEFDIKNDEVRKDLKNVKFTVIYDGAEKFELFKDPVLQSQESPPPVIPLDISRYRISNGEQNAVWHRITLR